MTQCKELLGLNTARSAPQARRLRMRACAAVQFRPLPGRRLKAVPRVRRYAMEAQSHLELSGIVYPPCPKYKQAAALAEQGMQGPGAMAPGQQVPPGEPSAELLHPMLACGAHSIASPA